jgi:putative ABC transport system permease protein
MQKHNVKPLTGNETFTLGDNAQKTVTITPKDLNKLTNVEVESLVDEIIAQTDSSITIDGGIKMIVIGSGITPDYIYPVVSFDKINPNPDKECILFPNTSGYARVKSSYEANPQETYIVGTFNNKSNGNAILNDINKWCDENMSYPGIKAAYMATDTNDVLNTSAMRIAFIPGLVDDVNIICNTLTVFVLFLSVVISSIVIKRYITLSKKNIGILESNGVEKGKIAFSLLPFALLPSFIGGISGFLFGFFLQLPALGFFKNF